MGDSRFWQQSADVSGRMGPHAWKRCCWCTPVNKNTFKSLIRERDTSVGTPRQSPLKFRRSTLVRRRIQQICLQESLKHSGHNVPQNVVVLNSRMNFLQLHRSVTSKYYPRASLMVSTVLGITGSYTLINTFRETSSKLRKSSGRRQIMSPCCSFTTLCVSKTSYYKEYYVPKERPIPLASGQMCV